MGASRWPIGAGPWLILLTPVLFLACRVLHRARGNRVVDAAFTRTSLTRNGRRDFAPGVRFRDLGPIRAKAREGVPDPG